MSTAYERYVDWKKLAFAIGGFLVVFLLPLPASMLDVGVEYTAGKSRVLEKFSTDLFGKAHADAEQWQAMTAAILEANLNQGAMNRKAAEDREKDTRWIRKNSISFHASHLKKYGEAIRAVPEDRFRIMMDDARRLKMEELTYGDLTEAEQNRARDAGAQIKIVLALLVFVVVCFLTEAMPMPTVAFAIGLILVLAGVVSRTDVAGFYWTDSVWFIMGSLMFAAAFVKTGVDRRLCLTLFRYLAKPSVAVITAILILVISPLAAFISDHALAAMFLPIAITLYQNSQSKTAAADPELARMLVITVAMACNVGGFGAPSGGARNVIMITYLEGMFGMSIGYGEWMLYGMPFVLVSMVFLWLMVNWRFKPKIRDLGPALATLKEDLSRQGGWTGKQKVTLAIFLVMVFSWITEKDLISKWVGVDLGIGVLAMIGALAFILAGIVNWKDYQTRVDWGVIWLYAGAIILGRVLQQTGTAYWLAREIVSAAAPLGLESGSGLIALGGTVTACITQLMADGPAAACVGPVTLSMAAVAHPGTMAIPFMALATACAASMAYLLVIGTPPNAIVYASGYLRMKDFLRVGIPCLLFSLLLLILMTTLYWPLLGFHGLPRY
jgi:anion transporter